MFLKTLMARYYANAKIGAKPEITQITEKGEYEHLVLLGDVLIRENPRFSPELHRQKL